MTAVSSYRPSPNSRISALFFDRGAHVMLLDPRLSPERHGVEWLVDIAYLESGDPGHRLDVYRPTHVEGPLPIIFYVHGGSFQICSKSTHRGIALSFAKRGYLVFNVEYRRAPMAPYPAAISDVCDAYAWVVENAERYGGDLARLVIAGESAGGNLVTALSVALHYERDEPHAARAYRTGVRPRAVMPACAILDLVRLDRFDDGSLLGSFFRPIFSDLATAYLGRHVDEHEAALDLASPLRVYERGEKPAHPLPPFFAGIGTFDPLVDDTRRLGIALHELGVQCDTRYYRGGMHAFHAIGVFPQTRRFWRDTFTFLDRVLR